jgi:hypothetical protein
MRKIYSAPKMRRKKRPTLEKKPGFLFGADGFAGGVTAALAGGGAAAGWAAPL